MVEELPTRKQLDHRGPISLDITGSWYFITICADGHNPWVVDESKIAAPPVGTDLAPAGAPLRGSLRSGPSKRSFSLGPRR